MDAHPDQSEADGNAGRTRSRPSQASVRAARGLSSRRPTGIAPPADLPPRR